VLTYARHAQAGRFGATRVTQDIDATQVLPDAGDVLKKMVGSPSAAAAAAALNGYNPPFAGYRALKAKLAELRGGKDAVAERDIPGGGLLKYGMRDPRVPALRHRFGLAGEAGDLRYDAKLYVAVRNFQQQNGLRPDGVIGAHTLSLVNRHGLTRSEKIDSVIANMERWRWLPRYLGDPYVMVDIPDFSLKVVHGGKTVWSTKVIVGKPDHQTPILSAKIDTMQINPTWHVPESIIYNEYLPALERDPRVLDRMGLVLARGPDGKITVQQPPGEENALGQLKFNFPNRFQVYLHDTPAKPLFARTQRAFSHGCMRVENPARFGEVLASFALPGEHYTEDTFKKAWGGPEQWIKLKRKIPVHVVYFNAYVDDAGKLVIRDDIYGFDKRMTAILKGDDRALAETYAAPEEKPTAQDMQEKRRILEHIVDQQHNGLAGFFQQMFQPPRRTFR
jgi:murein L,D-transpeptidase YcbB/YkuD